jgi:hypothetical protein
MSVSVGALHRRGAPTEIAPRRSDRVCKSKRCNPLAFGPSARSPLGPLATFPDDFVNIFIFPPWFNERGHLVTHLAGTFHPDHDTTCFSGGRLGFFQWVGCTHRWWHSEHRQCAVCPNGPLLVLCNWCVVPYHSRGSFERGRGGGFFKVLRDKFPSPCPVPYTLVCLPYYLSPHHSHIFPRINFFKQPPSHHPQGVRVE